MNTPLYPVILSVPYTAANQRSGREMVDLLRKTARQALALSAQRSGVTLLEPLAKDERGAPLPANGIYWSLSHKPRCVAAVVSEERVGIDVEEFLPRGQKYLFRYLATDEEWKLVSEPDWILFFRYWTAKEAATKATGAGLRDFMVCKVIDIPDEKHLVLNYDHKIWNIEHYWYQNHIISIVANQRSVVWTIA
ncbi:MAG: 4'-phosphopantetheinyl transferase superfamily protein [bacterium]|nr:4'-phosphopantetheinyl transferase superfamily protein [bacterium]